MDPDANLTAQRKIWDEITKLLDEGTEYDTSERLTKFEDLSTQLVELGKALDEWISKGGFLPASWRPSR